MDTGALWQEFKKNQSKEVKNQLISHYAPLVKYVAGRLAINLPPHIEMNDLVNDGILGLIDAISKFDPEKGIKFETYATTRIHGAMLDALRALDWVPRRVRRRAREIEQVFQSLEHRLQRAPTEDEVAQELGIKKEDLLKELGQIGGTAILSLDEILMGEDGDLSLMELVREMRSGPEEETLKNEVRDSLKRSVRDLPEKERIVITLYYYEDLTLKEITKVLNLSEPRVSQLHTQAILRLKSKLRLLLSAMVE